MTQDQQDAIYAVYLSLATMRSRAKGNIRDTAMNAIAAACSGHMKTLGEQFPFIAQRLHMPLSPRAYGLR